MTDVDNPEQLTVLSLCTGYGGLELGLAGALENPLRVVAVEIEAYALANLVAKTEEGKLAIEALWPDLKTFPAERFRGCFDFVLAGYPCQPFSVAGKRAGTEDPRHLWPYIERIIEAVRPVYGFFENVPGHLNLGFPEVLRSLRDMGYAVEAGLFGAEGGIEEGKRLFILAQAASVNGGLLLQSRRPQQADFNTGRTSALLGPAKCKGLQRRSISNLAKTNKLAAAGIRVAPQGTEQYAWEAKRYVEPGLDGTTHGPPYRVDRLRLLGNGVVPQQAERAFRYLMKQAAKPLYLMPIFGERRGLLS